MAFKFAALATGLFLATTALSVTGASAITNQRDVVTRDLVRPSAVTPLAMLYFCAKYKTECAPGKQSVATLSTDMLKTIKAVNTSVNRTIIGRRDTADIWELNPRYGDCEDYVISKRSALIRSGVPAGALRIAVTKTRRGEAHAVLIVKTNEGDLVLDNLSPSVKTLQASGYRISSMSSANPTRWVAG